MGCDRNSHLRLIFVCVAVCLTGAALTSRASAGPDDPSNSTTIWDGLETFIQTDRSVYELGEVDVDVILRLTNIGGTSRDLHCLEDPCWNVHVFGNNDGASLSELVYGPAEPVWSRHRAFEQVVWDFTLEAGQFVQYDAVWNMTDYDGQLVSAGTYEVVGFTPGGGIGTSIVVTAPEPASLALLVLGGAGMLLRRGRPSRSRKASRQWSRTPANRSPEAWIIGTIIGTATYLG